MEFVYSVMEGMNKDYWWLVKIRKLRTDCIFQVQMPQTEWSTTSIGGPLVSWAYK